MSKPFKVLAVTVFLIVSLMIFAVSSLFGPDGNICLPRNDREIATGGDYEKVGLLTIGPLYREYQTTVKTEEMKQQQNDNAQIIIEEGDKRNLSSYDKATAIATGLQESNLVNHRGGDRDSAGIFQQRPSQGWGTYAQVTDPRYAVNAFYDQLVLIEGRQDIAMIEVAIDVQRPNREAYYSRWSEYDWDKIALELVGESGSDDGVVMESEINPICDETPTTNVMPIVRFALEKLGDRYTWGDGDTNGYDGSGFVYWVYTSRDVEIPRNINEQWDEGIKVGVNELMPGDLIFWSSGDDPERPRRVAMYVGTGFVIEAPGQDQEFRNVNFNPDLEPELLGATRPLPEPELLESSGPISDNWTLPLNPSTYTISSLYGNRLHPIDKVYMLHNGIDLDSACGVPVYAASSGTVGYTRAQNVKQGNVQSHWNTGFYIRLDHGGGVETGYGHLMAIADGITPGAEVETGRQIGLVGTTGNSTGCHLHFVTVEGAGEDNGRRVFTPVNPVEFFAQYNLAF